jgi:hypothetical protein
MSKAYQPKTGQRCGCKRGVWRDNCPNCEGTGWVIDFRRIREEVKRSLADHDPVIGAGDHANPPKEFGVY